MKVMDPPKVITVDTLPLCLLKMGPPVAPSAVSRPLSSAADVSAFGMWMINCCSGLFSKLKNLLLSHRV